ncbi:MAG: hypothetical protein HC880_11380 [Bacteroidia bacterium]|nr:hypothetical protein [Bacteroidia bacterium]
MPKRFLQMIRHLREHEEVMLYGHLISPSEEAEQEVANYLAAEYHREVWDYPFTAPPFDAQAAGWAACTLYMAAQLMLYRESTPPSLPYSSEIHAGAILSADLCLRFLPPILQHLQGMDPEDPLIDQLTTHLRIWHYSGISYALSPEGLDFEAITRDACLCQLYINRIIAHKRLPLALHPAMVAGVRASLGNFSHEFWAELKSAIKS